MKELLKILALEYSDRFKIKCLTSIRLEQTSTGFRKMMKFQIKLRQQTKKKLLTIILINPTHRKRKLNNNSHR